MIDGEFYIAIEHVGISLEQAYHGTSSKDVPTYISKESVPSNVISQIDSIKRLITDAGLNIDDDHAGNYTIDENGKVWLIDLEDIY